MERVGLGDCKLLLYECIPVFPVLVEFWMSAWVVT